MYVGKTLFAQLMDFLPWTTFARIVTRYGGNYRVRSLPCTDQFRVLIFAQLTYRESLRDIEACLAAQSAKLYHMGIRSPVKRSTLADANERRDWRIYADFAQRLITQARTLYAGEDFGLDLSDTVYALDSTTIDLCLSVFPWAPFRSTKAAIKLHTLLDLRGNIPSFIHISHGKMHDVRVLDLVIPEPGAIYVMDRAKLCENSKNLKLIGMALHLCARASCIVKNISHFLLITSRNRHPTPTNNSSQEFSHSLWRIWTSIGCRCSTRRAHFSSRVANRTFRSSDVIRTGSIVRPD